MGAFSPFDNDIDNTRPNQPYVVDSDGWGWFMLFVAATGPFILASMMLERYVAFVIEHPKLFCIMFLSLSLLLGVIISHSSLCNRFLSVISVFLTMMPWAIVQIIYAIPYVQAQDGIFTLVVEWFLVTALVTVLTIILLSLIRVIQNGVARLTIGSTFLLVTLYIVTPPNGMTLENVWLLYEF